MSSKKKPQTAEQKSQMTKPFVFKRCPKTMKLEAGKEYLYCMCGLSNNQPFCDDSHLGTPFKPLPFVAKNQVNSLICLCRNADKGSLPYCDAQHKTILITIFLLLVCVSHCQKANFGGDFDSTQGIPDHAGSVHQQHNFEEFADEEGEQQQDLLQFSQSLGAFMPDQTFTFKMKPNSQEQFMLWPGPMVESIRGMFHCQLDYDDEEQYETGNYVSLTLMDGNSLVREYKQQRLGVFKHPYNIKDQKIRFNFKSTDAPLEVYFSYEYMTSQKTEKKEPDNITQIARVAKSFERVSKLLVQQQREMQRLVEIGSKHTNHLESHINSLWWRAILEGLALIGSSIISLWMLKSQIYHGYEALV